MKFITLLAIAAFGFIALWIVLDHGAYCPLTGDSEKDMLYLPPGAWPVGPEWWITAQTRDERGNECFAWTRR